MTNPQSWNRYAYVLNNPLSFVDPSGRSCVPVTSAGGGEGYGDDGDGQGCEAAGVPPGAYDPTQPATTIPETVYAVIDADASDFLSYNLYLWQTSINASDAQFSVNVTSQRAPSKGTPSQSRATACRIKVGVGIGLDAAGTAAGLVPGASTALVTTQVSLGLASSGYSAYNASVTFTEANATGAKLSAVAGVAEHVGWKTAAKAPPWIGTLYNAGALAYDVYHAQSDYQACLAGG